MPITQMAVAYLTAFREKQPIDGGVSYAKALEQCNLDFSMDSLKRIDMLLDQIRDRQRPEFGAFLDNQANQNFLYLLAFYIGKTVALASKAQVEWYQYDEYAAHNPSITKMIPHQFESSILCTLKKGADNVKMYMPLVAMVIRLFEGPDEKSVWHSAMGFV